MARIGGPGGDPHRAEAREQRRGEQREADLAAEPDDRDRGADGADARVGAVDQRGAGDDDPGGDQDARVAGLAVSARITGEAPMITPVLVAPMCSTAPSTARLKPGHADRGDERQQPELLRVGRPSRP